MMIYKKGITVDQRLTRTFTLNQEKKIRTAQMKKLRYKTA